MKWNKVAIVDCILREGDPRKPWDSQYIGISGPKYLGLGHERILEPGYVSGTPIIGKKVLEILKQMHTVVLQHWPHPEWINDLRSNSEIRKILLWVDIEAVPAAGYWSPFARQMQDALRDARLIGTSLNRFDTNFVDMFEGAPGDGTNKPHAHAVAFWDSENARKIVGALKAQFNKYIGYADGILVDNCMPRAYYGTASNAPFTPDSIFVEGMRDIHNRIRRAGLGHLWGNATGAQDGDNNDIPLYPRLDGRWGEMELVASSNPDTVRYVVEEAILYQERARGGLHHEYIFNVQPSGHGYSWLNSREKWNTLAAMIATPYQDNMGLVVYRSGSNGACLCPDVCYTEEGPKG